MTFQKLVYSQNYEPSNLIELVRFSRKRPILEGSLFSKNTAQGAPDDPPSRGQPCITN